MPERRLGVSCRGRGVGGERGIERGEKEEGGREGKRENRQRQREGREEGMNKHYILLYQNYLTCHRIPRAPLNHRYFTHPTL